MKHHTPPRLTLLAFSALAAAFIWIAAAPPAHAQINVYLGAPPPPIRYDVRPPLPGPGFSWVDGFWEPAGGRYRWHPGFWQQPPFPGAYYVHPHYDHFDRGWRLHEGYWSHEDHRGPYDEGDDNHGGHHDNGHHYGQRKHGHGDEQD